MDISAQFAHTLEQIGLTDKETRVYLSLLSLGSSTAYRIAENCGVKKPTVYIILENLRKKDLILKVPHAKKALFAARDMSEYLFEQEEHLKSVRAILPKLRTLGIQAHSSVLFFDGLRGVTQAMEHKFEKMRGKTFHSFYGNLAIEKKELIEIFDKWDQEAIAANISFQIIMPKLDSNAHQKNLLKLAKKEKELINICFLKQYVYPPNIFFEIGNDFIRIVDTKNLHATIIDNKETADAMFSIFKIVWKNK